MEGKMLRRNFLKKSGTVLGAMTIGSLAEACNKREKTAEQNWKGFKYAMCNESMQTLPRTEQCKIIAGAGFKAIEIAPFTLVKESIEELSTENRQELLKVIKANGLVCAGLHWLLAPPPKGLHFTTPDETIRQKTVAYLNSLIDFCGDLKGEVMIFGSPKQRKTEGIAVSEAKKYFADGLVSVAAHAQQRGVKILVEHLDHTQTDVVNTLAEAKAIIDAVNHPAIQMMFDFHNTPDESEPFHILIEKFYKNIYHVHVQEMDGKYLGTGNASNAFVQGFQTLKNLGYDKWISLEVFDFTPGGQVIADESMKVLKKIESGLV
jgi:sugar phosphate isomerase/epimerase